MQKILQYFHHIHHEIDGHKVHHCGGDHVKNFPELDYTIKHCSCQKHSIDKQCAIGHDFDDNKIEFKFKEKCPNGGWHIESGEKFIS